MSSSSSIKRKKHLDACTSLEAREEESPFHNCPLPARKKSSATGCPYTRKEMARQGKKKKKKKRLIESKAPPSLSYESNDSCGQNLKRRERDVEDNEDVSFSKQTKPSFFFFSNLFRRGVVGSGRHEEESEGSRTDLLSRSPSLVDCPLQLSPVDCLLPSLRLSSLDAAAAVPPVRSSSRRRSFLHAARGKEKTRAEEQGEDLRCRDGWEGEEEEEEGRGGEMEKGKEDWRFLRSRKPEREERDRFSSLLGWIARHHEPLRKALRNSSSSSSLFLPPFPAPPPPPLQTEATEKEAKQERKRRRKLMRFHFYRDPALIQ